MARLGLGVGLTRRGGGGGAAPTISSLFADDQQGAWFDPSTNSTLNQDSDNAGAAADADNDPVGYMADRSGRGNHATQATASKRPTYQTGPARLALDIIDDTMKVIVPSGGWVGTMTIGTNSGTASYGVSIPETDMTDAGTIADTSYRIGGAKDRGSFPGSAIIGQVIRNGALTTDEKATVEAEIVESGATTSYGAVTSMSRFWRDRSEIVEFPLIDSSSCANFEFAFEGCGFSLFPLLDMSAAITVRGAWSGCPNLTTLPAFVFSSLTNGDNAWQNCVSLSTVGPNLFDNVQAGRFGNAFTNTGLTQDSIDNILVSLVASNITTGTRQFGQSGGLAPSVAVGQPAIDTLRARGWTVTVTGGYITP
jgi:hypothetical protein